MPKSALLLCCCLVLSAASSTGFRGLRPHTNRADYAVTCFTEDIGVGASLVRPESVRRIFGEEIDRYYIVVEVGFYSKNRASFEVRHADFALRNRPSRKLVKSVDPELIVSTMSSPLSALIDKTLPQVSTSQAVAGYLFFPITEASASFELDYTGYGAWLTLPLRPE